MREPTRLLETPRSGLERDLLRSALTEVAPDAARARVLQSIDAVLGGASLAGSGEPSAAGSDLPESAAPRRGLAWLPGGHSRSVQAAVLSGALAVAASASVVLQHWARQGAARAEPSPMASVGAAPTALPLPAPEAEWASLSALPGALANTSSDPRLGATEAATQEELPTDWLGAQLQLLGQVRDLLESGRLEQASSLLDEYERRFPEGVVGPQIVRLRSELRERRSASSVR